MNNPKKILKLFCAIVSLIILLLLVDFSKLYLSFSKIKLIDLAALALISWIMIFISSLKWRILLGEDVRIGYLMRLYTISYFINLFAPSVAGGDLARSYTLGKNINNQAGALSATYLERLTGFVTMVALAFIFTICGVSVAAGLELSVYGVTLFAAALVVASFSRIPFDTLRMISLPILRSLMLRSPILRSWKFEGFVLKASAFYDKIYGNFQYLRSNKRALVLTLALSLCYHVIAVVNTYVAGVAIGWEADNFWQLFVVVPLILTVASVPISPNGIGITEGAFVYFLTKIGATHEQSLSIALLLRAKSVVLAMLGYFLMLYAAPRENVLGSKQC